MKKIYLSSCVLLLVVSFTVNAQTPVAYYPFNGNANDAVGTLNGTVSGAILATDRFGNASKAFRFDGADDNIDLSNSNIIRPTAALTISAWFNLENPAGAIAGRQILSCTENAGYQIAYDKALNAFVLYVRRNGGYGFVQVAAAPYLTGWHYIVGTFDGRFTRLYMDGVQVGVDDAGATFPIQYFSGVKTYIGAEASDPIATGVPIDINYYWQGRIDEVKIYNTALTAPQILQEYTTNIGPVAHYPFNGNANDAIGTHHGIPNTVGVALTTDRFGNANSAYNFDGVSGFISLTNSTDFQNSEFTYSAWVKTNSVIQFAQAVISIGSVSTNQTISLVNITNTQGSQTWQFFTYLVGSPAIPFVEVLSPNNTGWHHVVGTRSINELKLYVDGILIGSAPTGGFLPAYNTPMSGIIGSRPDNTQFFNGAIDEVKIYNTVLTAAQVQQDFASSNQPQKSGSGNAISFDGFDDNVTIANNPNINFAFNQDFTVDCWLKIPTIPQPSLLANFNCILQKYDNGASPFPYNIWYVNGNHPDVNRRFKVNVGRYDGINNPNFVSIVTLNDGKFHHIAFTKRGTILELFVDGISQGTITDITTGNTTNTLPLIIAGGPNNAIPLKGDIDEVRIWNAGMTQLQIRDRMCKKITSTDALYSNLVAYYNLDENSGNIAFDGTVNANNGTLNFSPSRVTSGAAIGNASNHDYVNATKTVSLTHPTGENFTVISTSGLPAGIQVYMVDEKPSTLTGANGVGDNNKYFGVFQAGGTTPQYTAVYNYDGNLFVTPAIEAQLRLNKRTDNAAASWTLMTPIPNESANTITVTGESTEYILGRLGGALPLNLISFTGSKQNNDAVLQWKTANEINVSRFEVQRSENGIDFITVGTVVAGSSLYSFSDVNTFIAKQIVYYRLKSIDADGKFIYSGIVKLSNEQGGRFTIFPNPVKDIITISGLKQNGTLMLFATDGKLLQQQKVNTQSITMDLSSYTTGTYLLQYENEGVRHTQKLIKH